jgi:hypothetical protein
LSAPNSSAAVAHTPAARNLAVDAAASAIRYRIVHPLHRVEGRSAKAEGGAVVQPDGQLVAAAVVPVASFRSGDDDRDARAVEILGRVVIFKGQARLPPGLERAEITMQGQLTLNGVRRPLIVPLTVEAAPDGALRVRTRFEVSLEGHAVERPSLLLMKVEDTCLVDVDLVLRERRG